MKKTTDKQIITALTGAMGKVCVAAERLGCPPEMIYARARTSEKVRRTIRFFRGKLLDAAESALWKAVLEGKSWAIRLALSEWGRSRDFSDGAEAWHAAESQGDGFTGQQIREIVEEVAKRYEQTEALRTSRVDADPGAVCRPGELGTVADDSAPDGDRPGDRRDDSRPIGSDSGD